MFLEADVVINKLNETHSKVLTSQSIAHELMERYTFFAKNYKFDRRYKNKIWSGKIHLFNVNKRLIYTGLVDDVILFCEENGYTYKVNGIKHAYSFSVYDADKFIKSLKLPEHIEVRDYQREALIKAVRHSRRVILSPTGSGKSLIFYMIYKFYDKKTILVVPNISLVDQMAEEFLEYSNGALKDSIHRIYGGQEKTLDHPLTISTWQSVYTQESTWFDDVQVILGDEAHRFAANSLTSIMENLPHCRFRVGLSGTLDGSDINEKKLAGLFGPIERVATTKELIDQGYLAPITVKCIILNHKHAPPLKDAIEERDYLMAHAGRNQFISKLGLSVSGNSIVYFRQIEKHGIPLKDLFESLKDKEKPLYYIAGDVDPFERNDIRKIIETRRDAVLLASLGTFSTGANIKLIDNIIFTLMSKSQVEVLQSIGRGLRTHPEKVRLVVYDIVDDMTAYGKPNKTLEAFKERLRIYKAEEFPIKVYNVEV